MPPTSSHLAPFHRLAGSSVRIESPTLYFVVPGLAASWVDAGLAPHYSPSILADTWCLRYTFQVPSVVVGVWAVTILDTNVQEQEGHCADRITMFPTALQSS